MAAQAFMPFPRRRRIGSIIGLWLVAEIVAFALVVKVLGVGGAILLGLGTSLLGAALLRRLGLAAARRLGAAVRGTSPPGTLVDDLMGGVAALLLIVPGFLSDGLGLLLAVPPLRTAAAKAAAGLLGVPLAPPPPPRRERADVIDLSPADWRVVEEPARRR